MELDLNFNFKTLDGSEMENDAAHAGKALASALSQSNKGNSIKLFDWAITLWNKKPIELDDVDKEVLKAFIESNETFTNLGKAQLLKCLKD